jgi:hypothetical protein
MRNGEARGLAARRAIHARGWLCLIILASQMLAGCSAAREPGPTPVTSPAAVQPVGAAAVTPLAGAPLSAADPVEAPRVPSPTASPTPAPSRTAPPASPSATATRQRTPTPAPQPLVPSPPRSRTPVLAGPNATATMTRTPTATAGAGAPRQIPEATLGPDRSRVCVGVPVGEMADYDWDDAVPGLYLNWRVVAEPPAAGGARLGQMVRTYGDSIVPTLDEIQTAARRNPGSLWLVGNEPDVVAQDNATPEQYARSYELVYRAIKQADSSAQVAIAGVAQPTPLRMAYLDRVLDAYRQLYGTQMPVDVWNVHAYILREQRDSWGAGIPPGMAGDQGKLYEIKDHADMAIFRQQIADFRRWMAYRGQRDKPLLISEYGILMPEDYGFPPELVSRFMVDTFDYFLTARDPETGDPADDNRLVQTFCWFSAAMPGYPTSDLFDPVTRTITEVGKTFGEYVSALK